jgi:two-component system phosphate regulon sensor histidine kinase PhoR
VQRTYLWVSVLVTMLITILSVAWLAELALPQHRAAVGCVAVALALLFTLIFKLRQTIETRKLDWLLQRLPLFEEDSARQFPAEFDDTVAVVRDVSERLGRMLAAADSERRQLEKLLDSMQDAVVAVDSAGRIQWTNERMQRLIPGNTMGSAVRVGHALVQTIRDPDVLESVRLALEEKSVNVRGANSLLPGRTFEVNASPMPGGGAVAVLHDITRIEEVERTQRDFVANVSHELRTPLTSITGYVETLLDMSANGGEPGLSATAREFLATILKNATRMNRLTEDLLVMTRVESPGATLNPVPLRSDVLVRDAVKALRGLVQENQAILEIGEMTETQIFADQDSVMQVLGNLIENAIKYGQPRSGTRSRVVISARDIVEPYDMVEFRVRDFGSGIASEHLNRIFERFYRVDKTRSRESGGTGLGLAIARHMVQSQGGTIRAESELGAGSTFVFTLPRALYPVKNLG